MAPPHHRRLSPSRRHKQQRKTKAMAQTHGLFSHTSPFCSPSTSQPPREPYVHRSFFDPPSRSFIPPTANQLVRTQTTMNASQHNSYHSAPNHRALHIPAPSPVTYYGSINPQRHPSNRCPTTDTSNPIADPISPPILPPSILPLGILPPAILPPVIVPPA